MKKPTYYLFVINELFMVSLALLSGYLLFFEMTHMVTPAQISLIDVTDITIALIFMLEFFVALALTKNKKHFWQTRWWELLASIPFTTPATQTLRLLRLVRVLRIFRIGAHVAITKRSTDA